MEIPLVDDPTGKSDRAARFETFYNAHYQEISGYVRRRVPEQEAADVIARVFVVAWRRFDQIPPPPERRLWLFGVARHSVAEYRRSGLRRLRLHARLAQEAELVSSSVQTPDGLHTLVTAAIARLRPRDREALQLVLWDDLSHAEAAAILGCSENAVDLRLRRARARLRDALNTIPASLGSPDDVTATTGLWRTQP